MVWALGLPGQLRPIITSRAKPAGDEFPLASQREQLVSYKSVPAVLAPPDGYPVGRLYLEKTKEKITC